jgi:hypothetical protein
LTRPRRRHPPRRPRQRHGVDCRPALRRRKLCDSLDRMESRSVRMRRWCRCRPVRMNR